MPTSERGGRLAVGASTAQAIVRLLGGADVDAELVDRAAVELVAAGRLKRQRSSLVEPTMKPVEPRAVQVSTPTSTRDCACASGAKASAGHGDSQAALMRIGSCIGAPPDAVHDAVTTLQSLIMTMAWPCALRAASADLAPQRQRPCACDGGLLPLPSAAASRYKPRHARKPAANLRQHAQRRSRAAPRPSAPRASASCRSAAPRRWSTSERIITKLRAEGYELSPDYAGADVVVVNTCGFLDSAKQESLDAIGEAMAENGRVVVTGCFGVEKERILAAHPGVLAVTGPHQYEQVVAAVHEAVPPLHDPFVDLVPPEGLRLTPRHYAYLKISEGCNNRCSFCIIPQLRGELASRPAAHVMAEAERLVQAGVKELLVISQDTSAYGLDIKYAESRWQGRPLKARFLELCEALGSLGAWVRLHYVYPYPHVDDGAAADGGGQDPALSRHSLPARLAARAEGHAPPRAPGEDAGAARAAGARSAPISPCARPSSSASPARPRRTSPSCSTG